VPLQEELILVLLALKDPRRTVEPVQLEEHTASGAKVCDLFPCTAEQVRSVPMLGLTASPHYLSADLHDLACFFDQLAEAGPDSTA